MNIAYLNGSYMPAEEIRISPDDRGFLFADGVYEVVRWYQGNFFDMEGHTARLKRSLGELRLEWVGADTFPVISEELIRKNDLEDTPALIYIQVTRGAAPRSHAFPAVQTDPTVYAFARGFDPDPGKYVAGINILMKKDIRWSRCDIKSVSLLPNILCFQEAVETGNSECAFVRDGYITECSHSNIFFLINGILFTHPESENILSGISRRKVINLALKAGLQVNEVAVAEKDIDKVDEAFLTNTSAEVAPVISINKKKIGNGRPGEVTMQLRAMFAAETAILRNHKQTH